RGPQCTLRRNNRDGRGVTRGASHGAPGVQSSVRGSHPRSWSGEDDLDAALAQCGAEPVRGTPGGDEYVDVGELGEADCAVDSELGGVGEPDLLLSGREDRPFAR